MELSNALKSLLATLTTKTTAANTDGVMLANISNGTPNGKMLLSNLRTEMASFDERSDVTDLNLETGESGRHYTLFFVATAAPPANIPSELSGNQRFYLLIFNDTGFYIKQFIFGTDGRIFYRQKNVAEWEAWNRISNNTPGFYNSYANLAQLTSAVYKGQWYGDCTTAADTAAKTCTISGFLAVPTSVVTVHFASAINVVASELNGATATLNISSTGAKPIKYKGVPVQPGVVRAGNLVTMQYDGTNYNIIGIEGLESSAVPSNLYVDMGLPSGTLWATRNVDITQANGFAASEYQYECSFFSWGNTDGHNPTSSSSFSPYDWGSGNDGVYASTEGSKIMGQLTASQDFARANCGAPWRLPTSANFAELFENIEYIDSQGSVIASSTTDKRTTMSGITGLRIRSTVNGNIIFFPCCGYGDSEIWNSRGSYGFYWSASLSSAANAFEMEIRSSGVNSKGIFQRFFGFVARPVM